MFIAIARSLLGPFSSKLDFVNDHPGVAAIILAVYLGIYAAGAIQLKNIKDKTVLMVINSSRQELIKKPNITSKALYKLIYPQWEQEVKKWAWFVPHRLELWPILIDPKSMQEKIKFTPEWVASICQENNIQLLDTKNTD
jgi:hypothetical protein